MSNIFFLANKNVSQNVRQFRKVSKPKNPLFIVFIYIYSIYLYIKRGLWLTF